METALKTCIMQMMPESNITFCCIIPFCVSQIYKIHTGVHNDLLSVLELGRRHEYMYVRKTDIETKSFIYVNKIGLF